MKALLLASLTKLTVMLVPEESKRGPVIPDPERVSNMVEPSLSVTVMMSVDNSV